MAARGVDTLLTNVCVEATVRDASTQGLRVILAADACGASRDQDHNAALHTIYRSYGDVRPTEEIMQLVRGQ
ncbi:isochorismatase family protein [Paramicrobacterium chengjingii]|uniref:isochorismatase family protein n=1 Tax=Paramicrobacterium chengjingii TaxID=2769067 RepID=UPI001AB02ABD